MTNENAVTEVREPIEAIDEMDKAMGALRLELPEEVWLDVDRRYRRVRALAAAGVVPLPPEPRGLTAEQLVAAAMEACERWWDSFGGSADPAGEWDGLDDSERDYWCHVADGVLAAAPVSLPAPKLADALRVLLDRFSIDESDGDHRVRLFDRGSFAIAVNDAKIALREYDAAESKNARVGP